MLKTVIILQVRDSFHACFPNTAAMMVSVKTGFEKYYFEVISSDTTSLTDFLFLQMVLGREKTFRKRVLRENGIRA
jgi:hypothetical protein